MDEVPVLTKRKRGHSSDGLKQFLQRYPAVQLATLVDQPPQGREWLHEIKLDSYRLLGFSVRGVACLRTRNGNDWTAKFLTSYQVHTARRSNTIRRALPSLAASLERFNSRSQMPYADQPGNRVMLNG